LRPGSAAEAEATRERLARRSISARVLSLDGLARGPGLAARARAARYEALESACARHGIVDLLLGHHAADQAETVAMRLLAGSGPDGLAGMAALAERERVRLLRPLLAVPPGRLLATLREAGEGWVEDPSNADPAAQRARLRAPRRDRDGIGPVTRAATEAAAARGRARAERERRAAAILARRVRIAPEGYAILAPGALPANALAALLRALAGGELPPPPARVAALAGRPRAATLARVRLRPAGAAAPPGCWSLTREEAALDPPAAAVQGMRWDGRFRLSWAPAPAPGAAVGALGADAAAWRSTAGRSAAGLPATVARTLPAVRVCGKLASVPRLGYADDSRHAGVCAVFAPSVPLAAAPFVARSAWLDGAGA